MIYQPSYYRRLDRALHHLESLKTEVSGWFEENPYSLLTDFDMESGRNCLRIEDLRQPPANFSLIIGDCLHNLRAALDNLVYELAVVKAGGPLPENVAVGTEFPIFIDEKKFLDKGKRKIGNIRPGAQTIIQGLQPYKRRHPYKPSSDFLWILNRLNNIDKHRLPPLVAFVPKEISFFSADSRGVRDFRLYWGATENNAVVADYIASVDSYTAVDMQRPPALSVAFGEGDQIPIQDAPADVVLARTRNHIVQNVVPPLLRHLA